MLDRQPEMLGGWSEIAFRVLLLSVLAIIAWRMPSWPSPLNVEARVYTTRPEPVVTATMQDSLGIYTNRARWP